MRGIAVVLYPAEPCRELLVSWLEATAQQGHEGPSWNPRVWESDTLLAQGPCLQVCEAEEGLSASRDASVPTFLSAFPNCAASLSQTFSLQVVPGSNATEAFSDQEVKATDLFWRALSCSIKN